MKKKWAGYLVVISIIVFFAITSFTVNNIESTNFGTIFLPKGNSFCGKNSFLQTNALPESYVEILTSAEFIVLMIICVLCLSVPITIIIHSSAIKRQKTKEEKFPWTKNVTKVKIDSRIKAIDFMQKDSVILIITGLCIIFLLQLVMGIFYVFSLFNPVYYFPDEAIPFGIKLFNFLAVFLPIIGEIIAGLFIGIGFIKFAKDETQNKSLITLGIFWLIWLLFSPLNELTKFIIINNFLTVLDYDFFLNMYLFYENSAISLAFQIFSVLRFIYTSLIIYFSARTLYSKEMIKTKGVLVAYSLVTWFILSVISIDIQVNVTVNLGMYSAIGWALVGLLFTFIYANMIIPPILAIITTVILINDFRAKQKREKKVLIRSKHDILALSEFFTNKTTFLQEIGTNEKLKFLTQSENTNFNEEIINNFKNRLDNHKFIVFMDGKKSSFPNFLMDFIKMSAIIPEIDVLFYTTINSKKIPCFSNLKWMVESNLESIIEFDFNKLPCIFILDKSGNELGKIERKIKYEETLVEELIFHLDVGAFI